MKTMYKELVEMLRNESERNAMFGVLIEMEGFEAVGENEVMKKGIYDWYKANNPDCFISFGDKGGMMIRLSESDVFFVLPDEIKEHYDSLVS